MNPTRSARGMRGAALLGAACVLGTTANAQVTSYSDELLHGFPQHVVGPDFEALMLCDDPVACALEVPFPNSPLQLGLFFSNFPEALFYYNLETRFDLIGDGGEMRYGAGLMAGFFNETHAVQNGTQGVTPYVFGRLELETGAVGTWTIKHPFGIEVVELTAADNGRILFGYDCIEAGIVEPPEPPEGEPEPPEPPFMVPETCGTVEGAWFESLLDLDLNTITNFPRWDPAVEPQAPDGFLGDPLVEHSIVGGPYGNDICIFGPNGEFFQYELFSVTGKLMEVEETPGTISCNGDGGDQMGCTDCPCDNNANAGAVSGCTNSSGVGARMLVSGTPSVSGGLSVNGTGFPADTFAVLVSGVNLLPNNMVNPCPSGSGVTFGASDGLRCVGGGLIRHGIRMSDANGVIGGEATNGWVDPLNMSGIMAGQTRHMQLSYRDLNTAVCGTGANATNAYSFVAAP